MSPIASVLANLLTFAPLAYAAYLVRSDADHYYRAVQEDQPMEWASFLAFLIAAALFLVAARHQRRSTGVLPWFHVGVALFCFVVAMEEISWAQRVFSYRPPSYFLEHNFQQEFNLHNVVDSGYRKLAVKTILLGYGVAFPLLTLLFAPLRRLLARVSVVAPPLSLAPLFLASYVVYESYPWEFTGEWVELTFGLGFLFAGLSFVPRLRARWLTVLGVWVVTILGGVLLTSATEWWRGERPELVEGATAEVNALRLDFLKIERPCQRKRHINKRIYSYIERYGEESLYSGAFAALVSQGLPEERARFFLDPWNSPYWIQCTKDVDRRFYYVYSFGPNGKRDSTEWELLGDDVGAVFNRR